MHCTQFQDENSLSTSWHVTALYSRPVPKVSSGGRTNCVPRLRKRISCNSNYLLHVNQLWPELSIARMNCTAGENDCTKFPTNWRCSHSFIVRYVELHAHIQKCRKTLTVYLKRNHVVMPWYCLMFKPYLKNFWDYCRQTLCLTSSLSGYCYVLEKILKINGTF